MATETDVVRVRIRLDARITLPRRLVARLRDPAEFIAAWVEKEIVPSETAYIEPGALLTLSRDRTATSNRKE